MKKFLILAGLAVLAGCSTTSVQQDTTSGAGGATEVGSGDELMMSEEAANPEVQVEEAEGQMSYTLEEVAEHASVDDCWLAIEGKVYDVTEYIDGGKHPGGEALLLGCGKDATSLFNERPNGSGAHSETARSYLPNFEIGIVAE